MKTRYLIDGAEFTSLEEFAQHFSAQVLKEYAWKGNLDAFNDILRGGFGTPEEGFELVWHYHHLSKERLGFGEMARFLERILTTCHPSNGPSVMTDLDAARVGRGPTLFDLLVTIIREHGPGGMEAADGIELILD